jgi:ADP-ribose pyrophosphatase YjhB (NUDIX family)
MDPQQVFRDYSPLSSSLNHRFSFCPVCGEKFSLAVMNQRPRLHCSACGYVYFHNPGPGVVVLVVEEDRFLLCRRSSAVRTGKWCLPGGYLEWDEDFLSAGIREVKEETGVDVEIQSILAVTSNFLDLNRHTLAVTLLARAVGGEPMADGHETDQVRWFSISEPLPDLAFEGDRHIIGRYFGSPFAGAPIDLSYARPNSG